MAIKSVVKAVREADRLMRMKDEELRAEIAGLLMDAEQEGEVVWKAKMDSSWSMPAAPDGPTFMLEMGKTYEMREVEG